MVRGCLVVLGVVFMVNVLAAANVRVATVKGDWIDRAATVGSEKKREQGKAPKEADGGHKTKGLPKEVTVDLGGGVKMELVLILAGSFMMGGEEGFDWEKPVHAVKITNPFYLGKYEVTHEQWKAVMGDKPGGSKGPKNPVENVSWDDCQAFVKKLDAKLSVQGEKYAIPTEAQWEYACRAGTKTRYCFGDDKKLLGDYAWFSLDNGTHPVGQKKPNAWGLYDMHGNVWEWCEDWYDSGYYAKSPADDPPGLTVGSGRVGRGGGWNSVAWACRSAFRSYARPGRCDGNWGFRVSRVPADR